MELSGIVGEGLLCRESIVACDLEGEVANLAIEGWIAGDSKTFGVVENNDGVLVRDAGVEPGETVASDLDLSKADGLKEGVGGGDVSL